MCLLGLAPEIDRFVRGGDKGQVDPPARRRRGMSCEERLQHCAAVLSRTERRAVVAPTADEVGQLLRKTIVNTSGHYGLPLGILRTWRDYRIKYDETDLAASYCRVRPLKWTPFFGPRVRLGKVEVLGSGLPIRLQAPSLPSSAAAPGGITRCTTADRPPPCYSWWP